MKKIVLFGCGGHAKSAADVILTCDPNVELVFVDENARKDEWILGFPVLCTYRVVDEDVFVGIGNNKKRIALSSAYRQNLMSVISPHAFIGREVTIGTGVFIGHNAHIGILSSVGDNAVINSSASIDHECEIGKGAFVAPNATCCGKVKLGENSFVGAGATVLDNITICSDAIVGAGAVVVKNIVFPGTYAGVPAKMIRGG